MSSRYVEIVASPDRLRTTDGIDLGPARSLEVAIRVASSLGKPAVLWIHESTHLAWGLPVESEDLGKMIELPPDAQSSSGWFRMSHHLHLALPACGEDFAETPTPADLSRALALFASIVGTTFLYSAPATALFLIDDRRLSRPTHPSGVPFAVSAFAVPSHTWARPIGEVGDSPLVQLFDRRGSYLAAWRSVELPDGDWEHLGPETIGTKIRARAGYYLVDLDPLAAFIAAQGLHDPFARAQRPGAAPEDVVSGPVWLTAPLVDLAAELADEAGIALNVRGSVVAARCVRALDRAAERLSEGRKMLEGRAQGPAEEAVLDAIKDAYTRGTAHLEFGRRAPHPLHRPEWRHTIIDRHVANTYRSLRRASARPIVVGGVDGAIFPLAESSEWPSGLRAGADLGMWRRRGVPVSLEEARIDLEAGRARQLLFRLIDAA